MEPSDLHIYSISADKKTLMKFQKGLLYVVLCIITLLGWGYVMGRRYSLAFVLGYIVFSTAYIIRVINSIRNSNKKIENSRLEIDSEKVVLYFQAEVQDSIKLTDIERVKKTWRGIKLESKNITLYDVFITNKYERFDEIEMLISNRVKALAL